MKKKELQELKVKEVKELNDMLTKKRVELDNALIDLQAGRVKNVHTVRSTRRDIARILTITKEKGRTQ
ncbi:50S ribosomal protein L29 [Candidatus Microgenomates bacterium]|nr:50S ribosomal protein L29 [Candidatus Microgenomates bacterium]